jgi:hypothetical protein
VGLLTAAGVAVEERTYDGDHTSQINAGLLSQVLPYMQQKPAAG